MTSTSISPRLKVKVRKTIESMASKEAEIGTTAGERGINGSGSGKGRMLITVSESHLFISRAERSSSENTKSSGRSRAIKDCLNIHIVVFVYLFAKIMFAKIIKKRVDNICKE